jgi:hypothetical protein
LLKPKLQKLQKGGTEMKEDEIDEQSLESAAAETTDGAEKETTDLDRRRFFGGLATVLGTAAAIGSLGLASDRSPVEAREIKSKILSRIQEQLKQEQGDEGMVYSKSAHDEYLKGGGGDPPPVPITPILS